MIADEGAVHITQNVGNTVVDFDFSAIVPRPNHFVVSGATTLAIACTFDGVTEPAHAAAGPSTVQGFVGSGQFGFTVEQTAEESTGLVKCIASASGPAVITVSATHRRDVPRAPGFSS